VILDMPAQTSASTVLLLPQTDDHTVCVELKGLVRAEDHLKNLRQQLEKRIAKYGWYNLLIVFGPEFEGWEPEAADISFKSIIDLGQKAHKLAYVNPSEKKVLQHKLSGDLFGGEVRFFNADARGEAVEWVKK
jgi:hypothetical protein